MDKSEDLRNKLVIEGTRIGVWDWNIQTGETYFNKRWAEIIGYTLDELKPININTWLKFAHPEDLEKSNILILEHFEGKSEYYDFESRMLHKDGHWVWVHDRGKVFEWDSHGKPLRMCGSHIEITEQKELEISLKKALEEREILLKEVNHRVKNNLQLIQSITRLKGKNGIIETNEVEDSISSISSAYEAIYKSSDLKDINIQDYILKVLTPLFISQDIILSTEIISLKKNIDFLIPIGLILTELTNNSIKYAFKEGSNKQIQINLKVIDDELVILYQDNGIGYSDEIIKNQEGSNSFGLSIIKGLLEKLDGSITFLNNDGANAEIRINLNN